MTTAERCPGSGRPADVRFHGQMTDDGERLYHARCRYCDARQHPGEMPEHERAVLGDGELSCTTGRVLHGTERGVDDMMKDREAIILRLSRVVGMIGAGEIGAGEFASALTSAARGIAARAAVQVVDDRDYRRHLHLLSVLGSMTIVDYALDDKTTADAAVGVMAELVDLVRPRLEAAGFEMPSGLAGADANELGESLAGILCSDADVFRDARELLERATF